MNSINPNRAKDKEKVVPVLLVKFQKLIEIEGLQLDNLCFGGRIGGMSSSLSASKRGGAADVSRAGCKDPVV